MLQQVHPLSDNGQSRISCKVARVLAEEFDASGAERVIEDHRIRREAAYAPRGRYRGQTQSQYLAIERGNGKDDGKAEAHSDADSSRAIVSEYY